MADPAAEPRTAPAGGPAAEEPGSPSRAQSDPSIATGPLPSTPSTPFSRAPTPKTPWSPKFDRHFRALNAVYAKLKSFGPGGRSRSGSSLGSSTQSYGLGLQSVGFTNWGARSAVAMRFRSRSSLLAQQELDPQSLEEAVQGWLVGSRYKLLRDVKLLDEDYKSLTRQNACVDEFAAGTVVLLLQIKFPQHGGTYFLIANTSKTRWDVGWCQLEGGIDGPLARRVPCKQSWKVGARYRVAKPKLRLRDVCSMFNGSVKPSWEHQPMSADDVRKGKDSVGTPAIHLRHHQRLNSKHVEMVWPGEEVLVLHLDVEYSKEEHSTELALEPRLRAKVRTDSDKVGWITVEMPGEVLLEPRDLYNTKAVSRLRKHGPFPRRLPFRRRSARSGSDGGPGKDEAGPALEEGTLEAWERTGAIFRALRTEDCFDCKPSMGTAPKWKVYKGTLITIVEVDAPVAALTAPDSAKAASPVKRGVSDSEDSAAEARPRQLKIKAVVDGHEKVGWIKGVGQSERLHTKWLKQILDVRDHSEFERIIQADPEPAGEEGSQWSDPASVPLLAWQVRERIRDDEYCVLLKANIREQLGISVEVEAGHMETLRITLIRPTGLIPDWNRQSENLAVSVGDRIAGVNDVRGGARELLKALTDAEHDADLALYLTKGVNSKVALRRQRSQVVKTCSGTEQDSRQPSLALPTTPGAPETPRGSRSEGDDASEPRELMEEFAEVAEESPRHSDQSRSQSRSDQADNQSVVQEDELAGCDQEEPGRQDAPRDQQAEPAAGAPGGGASVSSGPGPREADEVPAASPRAPAGPPVVEAPEQKPVEDEALTPPPRQRQRLDRTCDWLDGGLRRAGLNPASGAEGPLAEEGAPGGGAPPPAALPLPRLAGPPGALREAPFLAPVVTWLGCGEERLDKVRPSPRSPRSAPGAPGGAPEAPGHLVV